MGIPPTGIPNWAGLFEAIVRIAIKQKILINIKILETLFFITFSLFPL